jgi:hypothetical protein
LDIVYNSTEKLDIITGITIGLVTYPSQTLIIDKYVHNETNNYYINYFYKDFQQNTALVTSSVNNSTYTGNVRCLSLSNILTFSQETSNNGYTDTLNNFVLKYKDIFNYNGIDLYYKDTKLIFEGKYGTVNPYFNITLYINNIIENINANYSYNLSGDTYLYNFLLKETTLVNERINMSNDLSKSYYCDIILDIFNDIQDFGFQITLNGVQYYIPFNNNSGSTSYTLETIKDFVNKYYTTFNKNGLNISYVYDGDNHLIIEGQEPNIDVWELIVKVNINSSYTVVSEQKNNYMLITSNVLNLENIVASVPFT